MKLNGSEIIVETLLEQGTKVVFGYPGGAVLNIYDALYKYEKQGKIKHILASHEQHAGHAADGYSRASGEVGVVIATSGPGAANLTTAIATAYMDSSPLVAITGNVDKKLLGLSSFQELDVVGITTPITKHNFLVTDINELADTIRQAFKIAISGRKGPVLIDVTKDVTAAETDFLPNEKVTPVVNFDVPDDLIVQVVNTISNAKRPFIYAGGGVISSDASSDLEKFVKILNAPVSCSLMGQGSYNQTLDNYVGMLGMHGTPASAYAFEKCDLFLAIGSRFSDRVTGDKVAFSENKTIIHIDIDSSEHGKNIPSEIEIHGDAKQILAKINIALKSETTLNFQTWLDDVRKNSLDFPSQTPTNDFPVTPENILKTLSDITDGSAVITTEVGQNQMWAAQYFAYKNPRSFISSGGLGTMGFGFGAAIGAYFAAGKEKSVICVSGDGSFGMNLNELATLARYNIPVIILLLNNGVLGMVRQWQKLFYGGRFSHTVISADIEGGNQKSVDYEKLAEAFQIRSYKITNADNIEKVLKDALSEKSSALINAIVSPDVNVLPMVFPGKDITKPIFEME